MLVEVTSLFKNIIYDTGYSIQGLFAPSSVKKHIGGSGSMKKDEIYQSGWNDEKVLKLLNGLREDGYGYKKSGCWISDVLDAWAVAQMGFIKINK